MTPEKPAAHASHEAHASHRKSPTKCSFICTSVAKTPNPDPKTGQPLFAATLEAVATGSEENKLFFAGVPSGRIDIGPYLDSDRFVQGQEYCLDIGPA